MGWTHLQCGQWKDLRRQREIAVADKPARRRVRHGIPVRGRDLDQGQGACRGLSRIPIRDAARTGAVDGLMSENGMVRPCSSLVSEPNWQGAPKTKEHAMSQKLDSKVAVIGIDIGISRRGNRYLR